eukprot:TRINITY_DN580_c0_g1_i2.p2 TRINITY_DN580_c0_g1~~TRINITY_DN580_c0_g1_i2.p2  ORF type:complete len:100 (+),score=6.70 TRINITY_DN580_c0_g1_i2:133-432(+)
MVLKMVPEVLLFIKGKPARATLLQVSIKVVLSFTFFRGKYSCTITTLEKVCSTNMFPSLLQSKAPSIAMLTRKFVFMVLMDREALDTVEEKVTVGAGDS